MKMSISPMEIRGNWDKGYVLDYHVASSASKGSSADGIANFDTERTPLGELVYQLKYQGKYAAAKDIMDMVRPFLSTFHELKTVNIVIPVPPSNRRDFQPVDELAWAIAAALGKTFSDEMLEKTSNIQAKNLSKSSKKLKGSIVAKKRGSRPYNILLVDDLYDTGKTLRECVSVLKDDPNLQKIYVLAMTKAR